MKPASVYRGSRVARRTAVAYLLLASLWILLSDSAVRLLTKDPVVVEELSIFKGWAFVVVTAVMLFYALRKQLLRLESESEARMRATAALQEIEARQRLFIEHAPAALAMLDREMRYVAASRRWMAVFQLGERSLLGVSHYEVFPDLPESVHQAHRRGLAGEVVMAEADPYERAKGRVQWLRWEVRPWRDAQGTVGGIMLFAEDITERIVSDRALRESEERYRLLAEHVGDVVWVVDADTLQLLYISASVERQRGYTAAEVMARPVFDGMAPESVEAIRQSFPRRVEAFKSGDPAAVTQRREVRQTRSDGSWFWAEMVTTLARESSGALRLIGVTRSVDDRKRVELQLRESEERFRSVVEASPVAIFLQVEGRFAYVNAAALRLFGAARAEAMIGQAVLERFHSSDRERVAARIRALNERREAAPLVEEHVLRFDGLVADAEVAAVPFVVDGKSGALVFARDITEQKRERENLRMHEAVLRETGEIAKVGGWSFDAATGEGFWTDEVASIHGMEPTDKTSVERGLSFYVSESQARIQAALREALEQARGYDLVLEMVTAKGRHKWVRTIGHPVVENGKVALVRGSFQDVTELVEATAALRESEARFRELAETVNEVFWITDATRTQVLYLSPAFDRVWGVARAEICANPGRWFDSLHPEDKARVQASIAGRQTTEECTETYRIVRPDGAIRWIQDRAFPVRDAAGAVVRIVGAAADITEQKRIEAQFLRAQRLEAVGALAGGVAHDLNNILTPVLMAAGVLKNETEQIRDLELIAMIEQSARRGADIIRQLLAFSRGVEGERVVLQPRHLLREMASIIRETFPREISLQVDIEAELWPVEGNSTQLYQVLMNLCVNARDAMPAGGRLTLSAANRLLAADRAVGGPELKPGPYVVIGVGDTGQGMSPEIQARIFEPFFTTKEQGKGTGLGLSTVLGIVRSHDGDVTVYSEVGQGSQLHVYLPARPAAGAAAEEMSEAAPRGHGELILVVDDEDLVLQSARLLLQKAGYRVLLANNGQSALQQVLAEPGAIRLVLTDVMMPVMDGVALARALHTIAPGLPVLASSGLDREEKRQELVAAGVREILPKPCVADELLAVVARVLATGE